MCVYIWGFPGSSVVKNLPAVQESQERWVQYLGQEDPLGEGMATHSSILACGIPWTEKPGELQSIESQRVRHDWSDLAHTHVYTISIYLLLFTKGPVNYGNIFKYSPITESNIVHLTLKNWPIFENRWPWHFSSSNPELFIFFLLTFQPTGA